MSKSSVHSASVAKSATSSANPRFFDTRDCLCAFSDPILIKCPRCNHPGPLVLKPGGRESHSRGRRRFACLECAYAFEWRPRIIVHSVRDWHAKLPLLLQTPCSGDVLWAFNEGHLEFLHQYVSSSLRERIGSSNASLASRLPQWIKSAKNRKVVLGAIRRLRALLSSK